MDVDMSLWNDVEEEFQLIDVSKKEAIKPRNDYGINAFFTNFDNHYKEKFVANIYDDKYVVCKRSAFDDDHMIMALDIENSYGKSNVLIGGMLETLYIDVTDYVTSNQLECIIRVLMEAKEYYARTNNEKNINLSINIPGIQYFQSGMRNLDDMINFIKGVMLELEEDRGVHR